MFNYFLEGLRKTMKNLSQNCLLTEIWSLDIQLRSKTADHSHLLRPMTVFVSAPHVQFARKCLPLFQSRRYGVSKGPGLYSHHSFVITDSKWWIVITWLTEIYQRVKEPRGSGTRLGTAFPPTIHSPAKFIPFKKLSNYVSFFLGAVYIVMVTYHYHLMDVINFSYPLTLFHKPKQTEKVTSCTWGLQLRNFLTEKQIFRLVLTACKKLFNHLCFCCDLLAISSTRMLNYWHFIFNFYCIFPRRPNFSQMLWRWNRDMYNNILQKGGDILCSKPDTTVVLAPAMNLWQDFS
jgi:hypothetical protein